MLGGFGSYSRRRALQGEVVGMSAGRQWIATQRRPVPCQRPSAKQGLLGVLSGCVSQTAEFPSDQQVGMKSGNQPLPHRPKVTGGECHTKNFLKPPQNIKKPLSTFTNQCSNKPNLIKAPKVQISSLFAVVRELGVLDERVFLTPGTLSFPRENERLAFNLF